MPHKVKIIFSAQVHYETIAFVPGPRNYSARILDRHSKDLPDGSARWIDIGLSARDNNPETLGQKVYDLVKGDTIEGIGSPDSSAIRVSRDLKTLENLTPSPEEFGEFLRGFEQAKYQAPKPAGTTDHAGPRP